MAFVASVPPGPVNLWLINQVLARPQARHYGYISGVILADLSYIAVAIWAYFFWLKSSPLLIPNDFTFLSGVVIVILGLLSLWRNHRQVHHDSFSPSLRWRGQNFLTGWVICGSNVMLLVFWLFMANLLTSYDLVIRQTTDYLAFMLGCVLGDWLWFNGLVWLLRRGIKLMPQNFISRFQTLIALVLIAFGLFTAYR